MSGSERTRVEVKHAVPEAVAAEALDWSKPFLPPDRGRAGAQYISTLYLDSPELAFYRWHREGKSRRFKLRIRTYGDGTPSVFAEVKQKDGRLGRKVRSEWPLDAMPALLGDDLPAMRRSMAAREFIAWRRSYAARPTMFVAGWREALRDTDWSGDVAVTVDRGLVWQPSIGRRHCADPGAWQTLMLPRRPGAVAIVELKYSGSMPPAWMGMLLRHLSVYRTSYSKYVSAVRQHLAWSLS